MAKSGTEKAVNLAYFAKAVTKIIKAFISGSWYGAAIEAFKQFWPQILAISLTILILPIIIFYSLPIF